MVVTVVTFATIITDATVMLECKAVTEYSNRHVTVLSRRADDNAQHFWLNTATPVTDMFARVGIRRFSRRGKTTLFVFISTSLHASVPS